MPTICVFFGIVIRMYFDDHPPPHFHAYYGGDSAIIEIDTLGVREGGLPKRALAMVLEWALEHRQELKENWDLALRHEPLRKIEPLV
jgi:hypothetical protein